MNNLSFVFALKSMLQADKEALEQELAQRAVRTSFQGGFCHQAFVAIFFARSKSRTKNSSFS